MSTDGSDHMITEPIDDSATRLRHQRDFYRKLLELGEEGELKPLLKRALRLVVTLTGAKNGYIEVRDESLEVADDGETRWSMATGFDKDEIPEVRAAISDGVIAEALSTGRSIRVASALDDTRFGELASVQEHAIKAVLCAPIGKDPSLGVVYLQGRVDGLAFTKEDQWHAEVFARHLVPFADRLIAQERRKGTEDLTRKARERADLSGIVGTSRAMAEALNRVVMVAGLPVDVLLTGDTGTGKTLFARAIHRNSQVADGPFVELNCGTIPEGLAESELFGAEKGAHSQADRSRPGKIAAAEGGTLFLDEVGELPLSVQVKLLQFLQEKTYRPLGGTDLIRASVRLVAATNRDLKAMIQEGEFREDLFYRLHTLPIHVPSLAERPGDIAALVRFYVDRYSGGPPVGLGIGSFEVSPSALHAATAAVWPGNVRELANRVKTAMLLCHEEGGRTVRRHHLFPESAKEDSGDSDRLSFQEATRRFQRQYLLETLEQVGWSKTEAARVLDLSRSSIHNHIRAHKLDEIEKRRG